MNDTSSERNELEVSDGPSSELWLGLRQLTLARIAVGRTGDALRTEAVLAFEVAQAQARDAVHSRLEAAAIQEQVVTLGMSALEVESSASDRATYLRRPDAGRVLSARSRLIVRCAERNGLVVVIADGLSALAANRHALPMLAALLARREVRVQPPVFVANQARVALGDEIGRLAGAEAVLMLLGERPGLSTPDSLGAYLTWAPRIGCRDAERNCVSNIHANGLSYAAAAQKLALLIGSARRLGATGVQLHDEDTETDRQLS